MSKRRKKAPIKKELMSFDVNSGSMLVPQKDNSPSESRAVIYCRVSDMSQVKEGFGLEGQELFCKEWCKSQSPEISVDKVFIEPGISGADTNRKAFNACLAYLQKENKAYTKITHFVVSEASRISRNDNVTEAFLMEAKLKSTGVRIVTLDMPGLDDTTDEGHFMKTIQYAVAAYERKKIMHRISNGKINRLKNGYRPFVKPPVGYIRHRDGPKNYSDEIDPNKGPIIQEGLELFAQDLIITQADLRRFRDKKGLRTNASSSKKLHKTFPEKVLQLQRLFFYAGYIFYPDRGINEPIKAQHLGLISLETAHAIICKMQKVHKRYSNTNRSFHKMTNEHPLRGVIICPSCGRKFSSRTTTKYRIKNGKRIKKCYPYYGCGNTACNQRVNIAKAKLEGEFEEMLSSITIPEEINGLIRKVFEQSWKQNKGKLTLTTKNKQELLKKMQQRLQQIETTLIQTTNPKLYKKLEDEWSEVDAEREKLKSTISKRIDNEKRIEELTLKTQALFSKPQQLRKNGSPTMRSLLIKVRFGGELSYTKKGGLRTTDNSLLYNVFKDFHGSKTMIRKTGDKLKTNSSRFEDYTSAIQSQSEDILMLWKHIEYEGFGKSNENGNYFLSLEPP